VTVETTDDQAPPRRRRTRRVLLVVLLAAAVALASTGAYVSWALGGTAEGTAVRVIIPVGATAVGIAEILASKDVVRSALMFRIVARFRGVGGDLKPGAYELRTGLGVSRAIDELLEGVPLKVERFTVPEGLTVAEVAAAVAEQTHIGAGAFLRAARSGKHRIDLMPEGVTSLEGLLFPKTYEIVEDATAGEAIELMLAQFEREVEGLSFQQAARAGLSPYEVVIVASMIEKEARLAREQPLVSSVIYNRLARPQRLEIDATVQYVYIVRTGKPKDPLTTDDYELDSPFNTYRIDGLPPTPIAAPGLGALRAAARPADTPYFYYRLKDERTGAHCFNETFEEHSRGCA